MVIEGRDRISALRQASLADGALPDALKTVASTEGAGQWATFSTTIEGEEHALIAEGYEHALEIAREAVRNAYQQLARATRIGARIEYRKSSLRITISDDGKGIRAAAAADASPSVILGFSACEREHRSSVPSSAWEAAGRLEPPASYNSRRNHLCVTVRAAFIHTCNARPGLRHLRCAALER